MRYAFSLRPARVLAALALALVVVPAVDGEAQPLAPCPTVDVSLAATIDTKKVKPGEVFRFHTLASVAYRSQTIPAGTPGAGLIEVMDHSKSNGHTGYLILDARFLSLADGTHVPVAFVPATDGQSFADVGAGTSNAPGILGYIPYYVGTAAGVYNFFHHGKDAAVTAGTAMPLVIGDGIEDGTCRAPLVGPLTRLPAPHF